MQIITQRQGEEGSNSTQIPVKFTVSMRRRLILLFKAPYMYVRSRMYELLEA